MNGKILRGPATIATADKQTLVQRISWCNISEVAPATEEVVGRTPPLKKIEIKKYMGRRH